MGWGNGISINKSMSMLCETVALWYSPSNTLHPRWTQITGVTQWVRQLYVSILSLNQQLQFLPTLHPRLRTHSPASKIPRPPLVYISIEIGTKWQKLLSQSETFIVLLLPQLLPDLLSVSNVFRSHFSICLAARDRHYFNNECCNGAAREGVIPHGSGGPWMN